MHTYIGTRNRSLQLNNATLCTLTHAHTLRRVSLHHTHTLTHTPSPSLLLLLFMAGFQETVNDTRAILPYDFAIGILFGLGGAVLATAYFLIGGIVKVKSLLLFFFRCQTVLIRSALPTSPPYLLPPTVTTVTTAPLPPPPPGYFHSLGKRIGSFGWSTLAHLHLVCRWRHPRG
jgi:hypothetical protein